MCRRLVAVGFLNQFGFQAVYFVGIIGCATYVLGAGAAKVSALVFVLNVVLLAGYSLSGALIDRMGPRPVLVGGLVLPIVAATVVLAAPMGFASLLAASVALGLGGAASSTATETFPRYLTQDEALLVRLNSYNSTAMFVAVIAGPLLAGAIAGAVSNQAVFAILPVTCVPAALLALTIRERKAAAGKRADEVTDAGAAGTLAKLADGVRATVTSRALIVLFLVGFLGNLGFGAFDSLESLFYRDGLHAGAEWMGFLTAVAGAGATVGSLAAARVPARRVTLPTPCALLVVEGLGAVLYVGTSSIACAAVGQLVLGVANGAIVPLRVTLTQRSCELAHLGSVSAIMRVGISSSGTLPLLVAPFLADAFGVQPVLVGASLVVVACGAALLAPARAANGN